MSVTSVCQPVYPTSHPRILLEIWFNAIASFKRFNISSLVCFTTMMFVFENECFLKNLRVCTFSTQGLILYWFNRGNRLHAPSHCLCVCWNVTVESTMLQFFSERKSLLVRILRWMHFDRRCSFKTKKNIQKLLFWTVCSVHLQVSRPELKTHTLLIRNIRALVRWSNPLHQAV